jgi:hypothetical protein
MDFAVRRFRDDEEIEDSEFEDDIEDDRPVKRRKDGRVHILDLDAGVEDEDYEEKPKLQRGRPSKSEKDEDDEDDDEHIKVETKPNRRRNRKSGAIAKLAKQNTLTQMDFLSSNMWPEEDDFDTIFGSTAVQTKSEEVETKSEKQQVASSQRWRSMAHERHDRVIPESEDIMMSGIPTLTRIGDVHSLPTSSHQRLDDHQQRLPMPLRVPHTPQKGQVLEVPSSQTPQATPISLHSRRFTSDQNGNEPSTPTPVRTVLKFNSTVKRASATKLMPRMDLSESISAPVSTIVDVEDEQDGPTTPTKAPTATLSKIGATDLTIDPVIVESQDIVAEAVAEEFALPRSVEVTAPCSLPLEDFVDEEPNLTSLVEETSGIVAELVSIMAPPPFQPRNTQVNVPLSEISANSHTQIQTQTQTQTSQATKKRIQDFNLNWARVSRPTGGEQRPDPFVQAYPMGSQTQWEFLNDDMGTYDDATGGKAHKEIVNGFLDIYTSPVRLDPGLSGINIASGGAPQHVESSSAFDTEPSTPSPAAWKRRTFVPSSLSQDNENTQQSQTPTEELLAAQLGCTYPQESHRTSFSQASTVPGTPKKSQNTFGALQYSTQGSRRVISLVNSTPEPPEQTMSSSPIEEVVEESQFASQGLPERDDGEQEVDFIEDDYADDYGTFNFRQAHTRPAGISQLLPSSILNSDIPLPPRWQDSVEVDM